LAAVVVAIMKQQSQETVDQVEVAVAKGQQQKATALSAKEMMAELDHLTACIEVVGVVVLAEQALLAAVLQRLVELGV
jgi:phosphopantetheine adenylyltransferase